MNASSRYALCCLALGLLGCGGSDPQSSGVVDQEVAVALDAEASDVGTPDATQDEIVPSPDSASRPDAAEDTAPSDVDVDVAMPSDVTEDGSEVTPDVIPPVDAPADIAAEIDGEAADGDALEEDGEVWGDAEDAVDGEVEAEDVEVPPPPPEPVAWYRFEEVAGPVVDSSGNGLDGSASGWGLTRGVEGVDGGLAIEFEGIGGMVTIPPSELFVLEDGFTVEAWVKPLGFAEDDDIQEIVHMGKPAGNEVAMGLVQGDYPVIDGWTAGGRLRAAISAPYPSLNNDLKTVNSTATTIGPVGSWFHIAVTNDAGNMALYGNGQLILMGKAGHYMEDMATQSLRIGGAFNAQTFVHTFHGAIDEVKWWSVARSATEICEGLGGVANGSGGCALSSMD